MPFAPFARRVLLGLPAAFACTVVALPALAIWPFSGSQPDGRQAASPSPLGGQSASAAAAGQRTPLFHGQELKWPKMPFARNTKPDGNQTASTAAANRPHPNAGRPTASRFSGAPAIPQSNMPATPRTQSPQRLSYHPSVAQVHPRIQQTPTGRPSPSASQRLGASEPRQSALLSHIDPAQRAQPNDEAFISDQQPAPLPIGNLPQLTERPRHPLPQVKQPEPTIQIDHAAIESASNSKRTATPATNEPSPTEATPRVATAKAKAPQSPADRLMAKAHELSTSAESEEDYTQIIEACRQARASQPSEAIYDYAADLASWAFNRRGQIRAEAGRHKEALLDFNDALSADAECWRAIHNRGMLLAQQSDFEQAFDDFSRTIELQPEFAKAYSNRAALLVIAGQLDAAEKDFRRAIELNPELGAAHRGLGRAFHVQSRLDEALRHYEGALRLDSKDAYAAACRADVLTDMGRYEEAIQAYENAIRLDEESSHTLCSSAWLLATCPDSSIRNPNLALERAKIAIRLTSQRDSVSFDTLAAAQANAGDFAAAVQAAQQAIQLAPPEERGAYEERLLMYQHAKPYRIAPIGNVSQASYITDN